MKNSTSQAFSPVASKRPAVLEMAERAFEIFDQNLQLGPVERDAAAKRLVHQLVGDGHVGDEHFDALPFRVALAHA